LRTPRIFIAYAPRAGLRCAVAYVSGERDVHGWFTGQSEGGYESGYFVLEDFYTRGETRYVEIPEAQLHSAWTGDEALCHELARLQEMFRSEWLFYPDEVGAELQLARYAEGELAGGEVNVRFERLNRFSRGQATWTYASRDCEHNVIRFLAEHWPLDYQVEGEPA
jgi:hypothetical protein